MKASTQRAKKTATLLLSALLTGQAPAAGGQTQSQKKRAGDRAGTPVVFCDDERAVALVEQQIAESKTFEGRVARISVLTLAADLLWPFKQEDARAAFAEAYELASEHYRERGDEIVWEKTRADLQMRGLAVGQPDYRFRVIRAVARRDSAWAQKLALRASEETKQVAEKQVEERQGVESVADKILSIALSLWEEDKKTANEFMLGAIHQPTARNLPRFLYELARKDRSTADSLYLYALGEYMGRDVESLLLLSAYPFAANYLIGQPPAQGVYFTPPGFAPNPVLQKKFAAALLLLSERELRAASGGARAPGTAYHPSDIERIHTALAALDKLYAPRDPSYAERAAPLRQLASTLLTADEQHRSLSNSQRNLTLKTGGATNDTNLIDRVLEQAEQLRDPERHDHRIVSGLQGALSTESVERLVGAAERIKDAETRRQFLNFVYFAQAQRAIKQDRLDEATELAERIDALDERALVLLDIAAAGLKKLGDRQRAGELLDAVIKSSRGAPDTSAKARALLGTAHLYAQFDTPRALEVMAEAVKVINELQEADFSKAFVSRKVEGKTFAVYMSHPATGFNFEHAFRELGVADFESALSIAQTLKERPLRATAVVALSAKCLEEAQKQKRPAPKSTPQKKGKPEKAERKNT